MNDLVPAAVEVQPSEVEDTSKPWRGVSLRTPRSGGAAKEAARAETASPPDGQQGLSKEDRRVLKLILHGQGSQIGPDATRSPPHAEQATPAAHPEGGVASGQPEKIAEEKPSLAMRYRDGVALLQKIGVGQQADPGRVGPAGVAITRSALAVLPSPTAHTITIVFNGNQPQLALPHDLVINHDTHLILLRDPSRCFGLAGIPGLGADYGACLDNLRKIVAALPHEAIYCVGISAGGSSALRFGSDLPAAGMLCFSTPTTLNIDDDPGAELRHYPQLTILYKRDRSMGIDLAAYYRTKSPRPSVVMIYGENHPRDSWLAERMQGAAGVELLETTGFSGHKTYVWANNEHKIEALLEKLYTLKPVTT